MSLKLGALFTATMIGLLGTLPIVGPIVGRMINEPSVDKDDKKLTVVENYQTFNSGEPFESTYEITQFDLQDSSAVSVAATAARFFGPNVELIMEKVPQKPTDYKDLTIDKQMLFQKYKL